MLVVLVLAVVAVAVVPLLAPQLHPTRDATAEHSATSRDPSSALRSSSATQYAHPATEDAFASELMLLLLLLVQQLLQLLLLLQLILRFLLLLLLLQLLQMLLQLWLVRQIEMQVALRLEPKKPYVCCGDPLLRLHLVGHQNMIRCFHRKVMLPLVVLLLLHVCLAS